MRARQRFDRLTSCCETEATAWPGTAPELVRHQPRSWEIYFGIDTLEAD